MNETELTYKYFTQTKEKKKCNACKGSQKEIWIDLYKKYVSTTRWWICLGCLPKRLEHYLELEKRGKGIYKKLEETKLNPKSKSKKKAEAEEIREPELIEEVEEHHIKETETEKEFPQTPKEPEPPEPEEPKKEAETVSPTLPPLKENQCSYCNETQIYYMVQKINYKNGESELIANLCQEHHETQGNQEKFGGCYFIKTKK